MWYNLRMVRFLNRYCLFWPSANWSRSHDSFSILGTLFCTLQPYRANSGIAIKQDTCKQNRVASCKLRKTDGNKIFLAYFLAADFSHLCALEQSDAAMEFQWFFYTYWIWLLYIWRSWVLSVLWHQDSKQDHQRDGEVNRQVTRWNILKCGQTLPLLRIWYYCRILDCLSHAFSLNNVVHVLPENCIKLQGQERARHYGPCLLPCLLRVRWERSAVVQHKDGMISEEPQDSSRDESCGKAVKECFIIYSTIVSVQWRVAPLCMHCIPSQESMSCRQ